MKSALVTAAHEMLEQDGPEAISFRAIARVACVSQAAPHKHFQVRKICLPPWQALVSELETSQNAAAAAAQPGEQRITALGMDYVRFASDNPQL